MKYLRLPIIGLTLLSVGLLYTLRVLSQTREAETPHRITLRFAHTLLEPGAREAFNAISRSYEKIHPHVRIIQDPIPARIYTVWLETRLTGENVPDLVQLYSQSNERLLRHFEPLSRFVEQVNPYNVGTPLDGVLWRDTFTDGLVDSYNSNLLEYFGIPITVFTVRMFYNRNLLQAITGQTKPPDTFSELVATLNKCSDYAIANNQQLMPIVCAADNASYLLNYLFASQTQKLALKLENTHELEHWISDIYGAFLRGEWSFEHPDVLNGFALMSELGRYLPKNSMQMSREDAIFQFVQGRALMTLAGSSDSSSLESQADFPVGAFRIPLPDSTDLRFSEGTLGHPSEAGLGIQAAFSIYRGSPHREQALDFLRYLTSYKSSTTFTQVSRWASAVRGPVVPTSVAIFLPDVGGYPNGFILNHVGEVNRIWSKHSHLILSKHGSMEAFIHAYAQDFPAAMRADVLKNAGIVLPNSMMYDTVYEALQALDIEGQNRYAARRSEILESQNFQEEATYLRLLWLRK